MNRCSPAGSVAYTLYKAPIQLDTLWMVQYLASLGKPMVPAVVVERCHPPEVSALPAIRDHATDTLHQGLEACVEFYEAMAGEVKAANPNYRVPRVRLQRVFTEADFEHVDYEAAMLTWEDLVEYKKQFIGKPVPAQTLGNDALIALGYDMPEPWVQCCIEEPMLNWG